MLSGLLVTASSDRGNIVARARRYVKDNFMSEGERHRRDGTLFARKYPCQRKIVLDTAQRVRYDGHMKTQIDVTEIVSDLVLRGWSYAQIARAVGVQRAQPPRWHRGEQELSLTNGLRLIALRDSVLAAERAADRKARAGEQP